MILHSHNSWSYLPVRKGRLFKWCAKCQSKDILEQYDSGVRGFDLKVRCVKGSFKIVHGPVIYDNGEELYETLIHLNMHKDIIVRVVLDIRKGKDFTLIQKIAFSNFCETLETLFPNIRFYGGEVLYDHHKIYNFKTSVPEIIELYSSVQECSWFEKLFPFVYAKKHNKEIIEKYKDTNKHLMIDFI